MNNLLDVIDRVSGHQAQPFIAPIPDEGRVQVHVSQDSIPYRFQVRGAEPGWWLLSPNGNRASISRPAKPHEYLPYLNCLPRFYVIACYALSRDTWLVVPFNASDAAQRGWPGGRPQPVHLVRESVRSLDVVCARSLAGLLLYDSVSALEIFTTQRCQRAFTDRESISVNQDWGNAIALIQERRRRLEEQAAAQAAEARRKAQWEAVESRRQTMEDRIKFDLEFMGAELVEWGEVNGGVSVTWTFDGYTHTERLNRRGRLDVPGICLGHAETDYNWHTLSTLVDTIQEGRRKHRFDIPREAWL